MIVDEADVEMEMATDPFIEAGIEVPPTLPYQDSYQKEESTKNGYIMSRTLILHQW